MYKPDFTALSAENYQKIAEGFVVTCELTGLSMAFAGVIGLVLGVAAWAGVPVLRQLIGLYVAMARNTPPLVQLLFWYFSASYVLPGWALLRLRDVGFEFSAAIVAFAIYHGAFVAEIIRAGLNTAAAGPLEAARTLGMTFLQSMRHIVMPLVLRITAPPLVNECVSVVKNTSLAVAVGVAEMTYQYKYIDVYQFRGVEALLIITGLYFALCLSISMIGRSLDLRLARRGRPAASPGGKLAAE